MEFLTILLFLVGIILIVKGGDFFVDAASWIAEVSGIPKLIVGATIVSIATTLPELIVSVIAAAIGKVDMAVGNAVGSVTANIGLIMALSLLFMPTIIKRSDYAVKSVLMLGAMIISVIGGLMGNVNIWLSIILLIVFAFFIFENVYSAIKGEKLLKAEQLENPQANSAEQNAKSVPKDAKTVVINIVKFIVGAVGIVWGADLLVDNGSDIARWLGIEERIIGVTIVAVGTSLPELVTTITAIVKKQSDLSVGNILGANIIDMTLIMPLCAVISGASLPISQTAAFIDIPACLLVGLIAVVPTMISSKFSRWQGVSMLVVYVSYVVLTCIAPI